MLCYVTPKEHVGLPKAQDVMQGCIAYKIDAHAGDVARGIQHARQWDDDMSKARAALNWPMQFEIAFDGETARALQLIGDEQMCVFTTGRVTKTLTQRDRPRRLAFAVTSQCIGFERSVALRGGSFDLEPVGPGRTRVTLTTEYDALLRPRFMWTPAERLIVHALHEYILDAIAPGGDSPGAVAAVGP